MGRLAARVDTGKLFWGPAHEWANTFFRREDGLRVSVRNEADRCSVQVWPVSGRVTDEQAADVEHLLALEPGTLKRRHPMHPEFDGPRLPVLDWLNLGLQFKPRPPEATPPPPTERGNHPDFVLRWQVDPLRLLALCETCDLRTELGVLAMTPPTPWDFEGRAKAAEQLARERLVEDPRWKDCPHLAKAHVHSVAIHQRFERKPRPRPPLDLPNHGGRVPKEWYQQERRR